MYAYKSLDTNHQKGSASALSTTCKAKPVCAITCIIKIGLSLNGLL